MKFYRVRERLGPNCIQSEPRVGQLLSTHCWISLSSYFIKSLQRQRCFSPSLNKTKPKNLLFLFIYCQQRNVQGLGQEKQCDFLAVTSHNKQKTVLENSTLNRLVMKFTFTNTQYVSRLANLSVVELVIVKLCLRHISDIYIQRFM